MALNNSNNSTSNKIINSKCATTKSLLRNSKKRKIEGYYKKQQELYDKFEEDRRRIKESQQLRIQNKNSSVTETSKIPPTYSEQQIDPVDESDAFLLLNGQKCPQSEPTLDSLEQGLSLHVSPTSSRIKRKTKKKTKTEEQLAKTARRLAFCTLLINVMLTIAKTVASWLSGSLSIISSLVDSLVDITSGLVIWLTGRAIRKRDPYLYPVGRTRLEPIALIVVSVIMAVASIQMIVQSIDSVIQNKIHPKVDWFTVGIMVGTIFVKFGLFCLCSRFKSDISIQVLAQDHRNDCLSNAIALLCAFGAQKYWLYLDPIGAITVALYIAITWYKTGKEHLIMLVGRSAEPEFIIRIIKVCIDHDERIEYIDTVYVYHFGTRFLVEVHIVLDENMRLKEAHDIAESLQNSIESFSEVERAFVHVDYEFDHNPLDEHKVP
ncbi:ZT_dimer domain-containing protein [Meloidogyne graminicola]|uniref:ZT_dimer domain-containing protein n=1 Tax=Meloidogyne graminicola TaxID=189291 RepID=A0A8S9ZW70_9BILA|nr:ZT_dimer domain-containing protein [Meloidogyne graminicola]